MIIRLDPASPVPPYAQLQEQIATMVRSGVLAPGTRLPAIRHLAADLGVATGTVARAYRELEASGLVAARGRHGTVVRPPDGDPAPDVADAAAAFALEAAHRGADLDRALDAVRAAFARLEPGADPGLGERPRPA
ncbi:MAG TPA: GntR family transcriptional regulator [Iamia sp.]|nr:GntR family transcriptional regulator [Iamia sp.]